jgi:hypothetical protein
MHAHAQTRQFPVAHFVAAQNPLDCTETSHGNFRVAQNPLDCTYFLLNGEYQPTLSLTSGGWKRLRLVQSAHQSAFRFDRRVWRRLARCGRAARHSHGRAP